MCSPSSSWAVNPPLADQSQPLHSDSMPAPGSKRMEVSDGIANVPPIVEDVSNLNNETTQSNSNDADINPNEVFLPMLKKKLKSTMWQVKMCGVQRPQRMRVLMTTNLDTLDQ